MLLLGFLVSWAFVSCTNPFAPALADDDGHGSSLPVLGDQKSIDGLFENFRYSYFFKDTLAYGNLLSSDFKFIYRNYDRGVDVSWGRDEDLYTTNGLFQAAQMLDLIWNEIIISLGDSLTRDISRSFSLSIMFSPTDIVNIQGRASFHIRRDNIEKPWKIAVWRDESNY